MAVNSSIFIKINFIQKSQKSKVDFQRILIPNIEMIIRHLYPCIIFIFIFLIELGSTSLCPNGCSGRGICPNSSLGACHCFPGFHGVDCSIRLCPAGVAWYAFPSTTGSAHPDYTECSNMVRPSLNNDGKVLTSIRDIAIDRRVSASVGQDSLAHPVI